MKNYSKQKGFTLIELLVVIAIIALLSSVVFAATQSARKKAQETAVAQSIYELRKALEVYRADVGKYPDDLSDLIQCRYFNDEQDLSRLENLNFLPKYISQFPKPIFVDDIICYVIPPTTFFNPVGTCGTTIMKDYIIWYINADSMANIPLPRLYALDSEGTLQLDPQSYCLTGI